MNKSPRRHISALSYLLALTLVIVIITNVTSWGKAYADDTNERLDVVKEILTWHIYNFNPDQIAFEKTIRVMEGPSGHSLSFDGNTTANPHIVYSSFRNTGGLSLKVVSPDGTCVIGLDNCLVSQSTFKQGQRFATLTIGTQQYNIQYSGTGAIIQRFTITSDLPITGQWKVTIQKARIEQFDLEQKTVLKIKHLKESVPSVLALPKQQ